MPGFEHLAIFTVSFLLNLAWEFAHSRLYTTCLGLKLPALTRLLVWQSFKDAFWITLAYVVVITIYGNFWLFVLSLLLFSYTVERHAILTKRWEYSPSMPIVFGVGLTPLVELVVTGAVAVYVVTLLGM